MKEIRTRAVALGRKTERQEPCLSHMIEFEKKATEAKVTMKNKKDTDDYYTVMDKMAQKRHDWAKLQIAIKAEEC